VPPLLEGWKHKILLAGKYLNVIRECGIEINRDRTHPEDENLHMEDEKYVFACHLTRLLNRSVTDSTNLSKTHILTQTGRFCNFS
jgi:hypothetical protein